MEIWRNGSRPSDKGPEDWFTGTVRIDAPFAGDGGAQNAAVFRDKLRKWRATQDKTANTYVIEIAICSATLRISTVLVFMENGSPKTSATKEHGASLSSLRRDENDSYLPVIVYAAANRRI
jgi:hypothetical protein